MFNTDSLVQDNLERLGHNEKNVLESYIFQVA